LGHNTISGHYPNITTNSGQIPSCGVQKLKAKFSNWTSGSINRPDIYTVREKMDEINLHYQSIFNFKHGAGELLKKLYLIYFRLFNYIVYDFI
jgi:hypothetical protein